MRKGYAINANFFSKVDTQDTAYFLGLLYADGTIYASKSNYKVSLRLKDPEPLHLFVKVLESESPVKPYGKNMYEAVVCNKQLVSNLIELGCVPRKSKVIRFPSLDDNLIQHFVRGYFDGDGSVGFNKSGNPFVSIAGNQEFLIGLGEELKEFVGIDSYLYPNKKTCQLQVRAWDDVALVLDWMYSEASFYIVRKAKIYLEFIKRYANYKQYREDARGIHFSKDLLMELYHKHKTWTRVAEVVGYSYDHLKVYRRSLGLTNYKG